MKIPSDFFKEARSICREEVECVAFLFGVGGEVKKWRWMKNTARSKYAFRLDPEEIYIAFLEAAELEHVAIFHTHPGEPVPSPIDIYYMGLWRVVWIIADIYTWRVAAWRVRERKLEKVEIYIE
ncbi:MAG: Mov34/MPN/PAD-1 family protein [Pyrobaculum sp.]